MSKFHITFAIKPVLIKKQQWHTANGIALFDLCTKWKKIELPANDLNCVHADFSSKNCISMTDNCVQSWVHSDSAKLSSFQDVNSIDFEDIYNDDAPDLDIVSLCIVAVLQSGLDFSEGIIPTNIILTVINSITSQAITPAEQALGKFTCCKLKNMDT